MATKCNKFFQPLVWCVFITLLLVACGSDRPDPRLEAPKTGRNVLVGSASQEQNETESEAGETASTATDGAAESEASGAASSEAFSLSQLPAPERGALTLPAAQLISGRLVFLRGNSLYLARFDGQPATPLAQGLDIGEANWVSVTSDGTKAVYLLPESARFTGIMLTDLNTNQTIRLLREGGNFGIGPVLSPDGQWVLVSVFQFGTGVSSAAVRVDGSQTVEIPGNDNINPQWTLDNQIVYFERTGDDGLTPVSLLNLTTGESTPLGVSVDLQSQFDLRTLLSQTTDVQLSIFRNVYVHSNFGALFDPATDEFYSPVSSQVFTNIGQATIDTCATWTIQRSPAANPAQFTVLAEFPQTMLLSDLQLLEEEGANTLFFLRWYFPDDCTEIGADASNLRIQLVQWRNGSEPEVLIEGLDPGVNRNLGFIRGTTGQKYAISPDRRFIMWIGGNASESALHLFDREAGQSVAVLIEQQTGTVNSFLENQVFQTIFWIP